MLFLEFITVSELWRKVIELSVVKFDQKREENLA